MGEVRDADQDRPVGRQPAHRSASRAPGSIVCSSTSAATITSNPSPVSTGSPSLRFGLDEAVEAFTDAFVLDEVDADHAVPMTSDELTEPSIGAADVKTSPGGVVDSHDSNTPWEECGDALSS